ncbi:hypothetical protein [Pendulispora albinea]|uniref:DUF4397 domain-containing protein n=1 Tax=Pendulispora albinea TaxID=2741071 RepID=A0ABZ2LVP0_9BACT
MRSPFIGIAVLVSALVPISVVACIGSSGDPPSDDRGVAEQETVIRPDGSDFPAHFKVVTPAGSSTKGTVRIDGISGSLDALIGPVKTGNRAFSITSGGIFMESSATVTAGKVTTVEAGLLAVDIKNAPSPTLGISSVDGIQAPSVNVWRNVGGSWIQASNGSLPLTSDGTEPAALLPGQYRVDFGYNRVDGQIVDVAALDTKSIKVWDYAGRNVAKIVAPVREFPTAKCATGVYTLQDYRLLGSSSNSFRLADGASSIEIGKREDALASYYFTISGVYEGGGLMRIPLPLGNTGQGALPFQVGRLDVDHVAVLQSDGTTKIVPGGYRVYRKTGTDPSGKEIFTSSPVACDTPLALPTQTGVDLPRGRYKVVVEYSTVEAGRKESIYIVDVE